MPEMRSGWEAALAEARSSSWSQRVRAGRDLARFAEVPDAAEALLGLLLDAEDTAVTRQTAEALTRVGTVAAVRLIALAVAEADDNQADWLQTGVHDAFVEPGRRQDIAAACAKLAREPEAAVRRGAATLSAWTQAAMGQPDATGSMTGVPAVTRRDEFAALVVRTDYDDDQAWRDTVAALMEPWGDRPYEARVHLVDDQAWAGATVDDVLTAVRADEDLAVVFLADRATMQDATHALLTVTTLTREECVDDEDYEQLTEFGREFRTAPAGVHDVHANLSIGNLGFEEYAAWAHDDPEGIYRSF